MTATHSATTELELNTAKLLAHILFEQLLEELENESSLIKPNHQWEIL